MGIKGLLPQLSDITTHINISSYKGYKVGVDAYVWLHQKAIGCATELCLEQPTNRYVNSFMKEVRTLLHNGVIPVIVFDGTFLPLKSRVEEERSKSRKANLKQGKKLYRQGKKSEAYQRFVKAIDITPQMAYEVMVQLKQLNIEYYVAPYEADAQLAYLYKIGSIFAVISIDSDLLVFGVHRLLTKYHQGWVKEVDLTKLNTNFSPLNFSQFSIEMFVQFCIFCGCDYLDKIPGIGPKKFHEYMLRRKKWQNVVKWILFEGKYKIPKGYEANFQRALYTFRHQRVYDPTHKRLVHLDPLPADQPDIGCDATDFLGPDMAPNIAQQIAEGIIDPFTKHIFKTNGHSNTWKKVKHKQQTNTMLSYLSNNNNKHRNSNEISLPDGTQCPSPPPPAVLVEKSFERHRETIQIISDNMEKLQSMGNSNGDNIGNRKKQKANNASQHYQSLESFSFNSNANGDNMDKLQRIGNRKKKANHSQSFNSNANGNNNNKDNELSQTQQIDSIRNRHRRKKAASQTQSNNSNGNKHYHQFKRVMPRKNIPHKHNNDSSDNLDAKMLQFAFNPNKAAKTERPSRKRRRSELLLPTKPMGSVDYNNSLSAHSDNTSITSSGYEARPHQFRPPRIKHKTKKRKLNTNYRNRKKFESPFIPKETQNLALAAGANINSINISRFAFEPLATKPLRKRNSSSNSNASNPSTAESVASFNSDTPIATNEQHRNHNHNHIAETQSPQFPDALQNTAETMESIGYISETPDVDDIDVHNANNYRASSVEMANNNNNNILNDDDILTIDNELNLNAMTASPIDTESNSINITDCIDLTNDDIEDNQQRQRQIVIVDDMDDDDDDIDVLDDDIDVNGIVLSDEDTENDGFDDDQRRSAMSESPLNWRRKKPRSTSPDLFDPSSPDLGMENNDDLLSQHIALQINSNHIIDITDSLNEEEGDDDDDVNDINDIINGVCDSDDVLSDDLNIDTMPIDDVIRNPVSRQHASRYRRKQHRNQRRLQLGVVSDVSMLKENDYF